VTCFLELLLLPIDLFVSCSKGFGDGEGFCYLLLSQSQKASYWVIFIFSVINVQLILTSVFLTDPLMNGYMYLGTYPFFSDPFGQLLTETE
jgi:hypothetical protein